MKIIKPNFIERILMIFAKKRVYLDTSDAVEPKRWIYKKVFGKKFVVDFYPLPPMHCNCRCIPSVANSEEKNSE